ncbi:zinc finger protein syd-9-like [Palaemon carinicauda]|uniref:zinc finger protein syd-9-like n=1 Tax=Palaemon carinicauda TaxID=392227 RepID=UPI0035B58975
MWQTCWSCQNEETPHDPHWAKAIGAELHGNVCKVCGKVFNGRNWKQNLEYHFLTHTKEKPYKCTICPHSSALKYNLIRHIRNRHWEVLAPTYHNASGEREGTDAKNLVLSNRDMRSTLNQEAIQLSSERIMELAAQLSTGLGNQNQSQQESLLNLNQNFQMALSGNQESQMFTSNNDQAIQMATSTNQAAPIGTGSTQHLSQSVASLNAINIGLEIPISSNQEMEVPVNRDVHLPGRTSQTSSMLIKDENQMLIKKESP